MNKDKRNNIQLLGTLNNADESGIIANANQIYDANEDKSTQDVSKEHTERIKDLENKEDSMQTTLENITKTGEASAASNVTYNHNDSHLDATNVQQAVDEMRELINTHEGNIKELQDNVNEINQEIQVTDGPDDFSIQDEEGNILCLWKDGNIKTKNFDSQGVGGKAESDSDHIKFKTIDGKSYEKHEYIEKPIPTISFVTPLRYCNASDAAASYTPTTNKFAAAMIAVTSQDVVTIHYLMGIALDTTDSAYATQGTGDYPITLGLYDSAQKLIGVLDKTTTAQTNKVIDFRKELTLVKSSTTSTYTLTAGSTYYLYIQTQANSSSVTDSSTTEDYVNACKNQINAITIESHVLKDIKAIDANSVDVVDSNNGFDFDIEDENQNILVGLRDGHIKTKNFDSKETLQVIDGLKNELKNEKLNGISLKEDTFNDFSIKDENGNAIVTFKEGHIQTKNFDSRNINIESPKTDLNYTYEATSKIILTKPELKFDIKEISGTGWGCQGFCIYEDYALVFSNAGAEPDTGNNKAACRIFKITDKNGVPSFSAITSAFLLDGYTPNHANTASFGKKYESNDDFPLMYMPRCIIGSNQNCVVERIALDGSSTKVQEISIGTYRDEVTALSDIQWTTNGKYLYLFGNTKSSYTNPGNKFVFCKLNLPDNHAGDIALNLNDAIEFYYFEDYGFHNTNVLQGCKVINDMMILPVGVGSSSGNTKSHLYFWDINQRRLKADIDLSSYTRGEFEDTEIYKDSLLIFVVGGSMYQLRF